MNKTTNIELFESTLIFFDATFETFDATKLQISVALNSFFDVLIAYSLDNINYSEYISQAQYQSVINYNLPLYVCIFCKRSIQQNLETPNTIYQNKNVNDALNHIIIESIKYNNQSFDFNTDFKFKTYYQLIDEYPRWNFYDNQHITIRRWLDQCNAINEMYGISCIYFKTEPNANGVIHTLANNTIRDVVGIKKILINSQELPQDRNIYSDWDMPLQDEYMIQIIWEKFKLAFGEKAIPNEKDYLYLPMINKLFRVSTTQPKNGFMGVIGWWEVYLAKFEDDSTVRVSSALKESLSGIPNFVDALNKLNYEETYGDNEWYDDYASPNKVQDELDALQLDTVRSADKIHKETVEEKKLPTENFTNKFLDTTFEVSLKETEKLREFYDRRLEIVSVNPDDSLFPTTMYNCQTVDKRVIALQYNFEEYTTKNKFTTIFKTKYVIGFNIVLVEGFSGELIDVNSGDISIITVLMKFRQFNIVDNLRQQTIVVDYKLDKSEFYNVVLEYQSTGQYAIKIFKLLNKEKTLVYQNIYIFNNDGFPQQINFTKMFLFGGKFLLNDLQFDVNENQILLDKVNPLLKFNKFG